MRPKRVLGHFSSPELKMSRKRYAFSWAYSESAVWSQLSLISFYKAFFSVSRVFEDALFSTGVMNELGFRSYVVKVLLRKLIYIGTPVLLLH